MTKSIARNSEQRGFTLVEVMVALLIIALSLTGIAVTMSGMLNNATALRERTYASWIAQNKIIEIRASGAIPETGETSGEVDFANSEWAWRSVISETGIENFYRIDVSVSWPDAEGEIRTVTGFAGEPVAPGQANRIWIAGAGQRGGNPGATN
ncbi:MAG: type II secretion system minor pseudopilin GspI [Gammaproteobacteria bacterium]|nr:type II secretion system minor pseudopilin GspI [Gammaproteobacteria bacterium]